MLSPKECRGAFLCRTLRAPLANDRQSNNGLGFYIWLHRILFGGVMRLDVPLSDYFALKMIWQFSISLFCKRFRNDPFLASIHCIFVPPYRIVRREGQEAKARLPILVTELGMVIEEREEHP